MPKKPGQKPKKSSDEIPKSRGLFDHIKHIQYQGDPEYFDQLSDSEQKSFKQNLFLILRGLSMNPAFVEYAAYLYRFLDIIPPRQFYKILIELYPKHRYKEFHRWIKSRRESDDDSAKKKKSIVGLIVQKYEISEKEASSYVDIFLSDKEGKNRLIEFITGFGFSEKEAKDMI